MASAVADKRDVQPPRPKFAVDDEHGPLRLSVDQFLEMVAADILPEDASHELIDGVIYRRVTGPPDDPYTMNPPHADAVQALLDLLPRFGDRGCHLRLQLPVKLSDGSLVFPDAAILRGSRRDIRGRTPGPADVLALVEIADTSASRDRKLKLPRYAAAGVATYVIVVVPGGPVEFYRDPTPEGGFRSHQTLGRGDVLKLPTGTEATVDIPVDGLLPPEERA